MDRSCEFDGVECLRRAVHPDYLRLSAQAVCTACHARPGAGAGANAPRVKGARDGRDIKGFQTKAVTERPGTCTLRCIVVPGLRPG